MKKNKKACPPCFRLSGCRRGFSIVEIVLAAGIFAVFSLAILMAVLRGSSAGQSGMRSELARNFAIEGVEAVRAVRNQSFDALGDTAGSGIRLADGNWELFGTQDEWEGYQRTIEIEPAQRDGNGNLVVSGGTEDADLKLAKVTVVKDDFSLEFSFYLSRREIIIVTP